MITKQIEKYNSHSREWEIISNCIEPVEMTERLDRELDSGNFEYEERNNTTSKITPTLSEYRITLSDGVNAPVTAEFIGTDKRTILHGKWRTSSNPESMARFRHTTALTEGTKLLQGEIIEGMAVTQPKEVVNRKSLYDVVERLLLIYNVRSTNGRTNSKYQLTADPAIVSLLQNTEAPQFRWNTQTTLWEALCEVGDVINAIPRISQLELPKLATPQVTINAAEAQWPAVTGATGYKYIIDGETEGTTSIYARYVSLESGQSVIVKAVGDGINVSDSDYSLPITYIMEPPTNIEAEIWLYYDYYLPYRFTATNENDIYVDLHWETQNIEREVVDYGEIEMANNSILELSNQTLGTDHQELAMALRDAYKGEVDIYFNFQDYNHGKSEVTQDIRFIPIDKRKGQLSTPSVEVSVLDSGRATWADIPNARSYEYRIDNGAVVETSVKEVQLSYGQTIEVRAIRDNHEYAASNWSQPQQYKLIFVKPDVDIRQDEYTSGGYIADYFTCYNDNDIEVILSWQHVDAQGREKTHATAGRIPARSYLTLQGQQIEQPLGEALLADCFRSTTHEKIYFTIQSVTDSSVKETEDGADYRIT